MAITEPKPRHDHATLTFPEGFLWGTATSAHQVEGNNIHSDWWEWEQTRQPPDKRSGDACDQYNLYQEDFDLAQKLGHNAHRLSIEWARIEPEEGKFDADAIEHYLKVLKSLKELRFEVMLTLHHFTNPLWFSKKGGWENGQAPFYFNRFVEKIVPILGEYVDLWTTINEPNVLISTGYLMGNWPPQKKSKRAAFKVLWNISQAHRKAYWTIHHHIPQAKVGLTQNVSSFNAFHHHNLFEDLAEWVYDLGVNHSLYLFTGKTHDFLGLNYYMNQYISFNGQARLPKPVDISTIKTEVSDMGWEIFPEGIFDIIMDFSDYHLPIYITENGVASTNDDRRVRFLLSYLKEIYHAIASGIEVKGYFHWSLIDNFEWAEGFKPRFGLVDIDYQTQKRTPRPSSYVYREIIKNNGIPHKLLKLLGHGIRVEEVIKEMV